jgi:hypothetical protein
MRIHLVHNKGAGYSGHKEIGNGTTIGDLFFAEMGRDARPGDFLIRVNQEEVKASQVLQQDDYVSITPTKVAGA